MSQRIISIVPSQTELLADLGLEKEVIGITKFCIYPQAWFKGKERVGGTKNLHLERIASLNPTLIIANKEENTQSEVEWLQTRFPTYISDIYTLNDALQMIGTVGKLTEKSQKAEEIIQEISTNFNQLILPKTLKKALYLIWREPFMAAAQHTFIDAMLPYAGFENVLSEIERYPILEKTAIQALAPDYILLSSEPYPFKGKHIQELQEICPTAKIELVDGELFSWYGSRLRYSAAYFRTLI